MTFIAALKLGRVSNLPTVWTNCITGIVLAGGSIGDPRTGFLLLALSLFYVGGMYLNDAFDADIDLAERPDRPIPSGAVRLQTAFLAGFGLILIGLILLAWIGFAGDEGTGGWSALAGLGLATAIILYDWHHKDNGLSPVFMAVCRMLVYLTAGLAFLVPPPAFLLFAALLLFAYLIGLTYIAKQERLDRVDRLWPLLLLAMPVLYGLYASFTVPTAGVMTLCLAALLILVVWLLRRRAAGDVPRSVHLLIAGICLLDAILVASVGEVVLASYLAAGFLLTALLQRIIPGT